MLLKSFQIDFCTGLVGESFYRVRKSFMRVLCMVQKGFIELHWWLMKGPPPVVLWPGCCGEVNGSIEVRKRV